MRIDDDLEGIKETFSGRRLFNIKSVNFNQARALYPLFVPGYFNSIETTFGKFLFYKNMSLFINTHI